ncbi:hypothetical protein F2Q69_00004973 [Brassica cretica]|uniref:Uncharacterized protein n=1 Tax=Brassica cretica TaxID=69181 RepID=A0A8S9PL94_BRACR|nr:hypothetical protein F2Q69_00004973 [Brassica cretica]
MEKALAQSNGPSNQLVLQAENLELGLVSTEEAREELTEETLELSLGHLQSPLSVEPKDLSTPVNNLTYSKVHIANGSNSVFISSPLADTQSAPTKAPIMEEIPSPVIVLEASGVSADNSLVPPYSSVHAVLLSLKLLVMSKMMKEVAILCKESSPEDRLAISGVVKAASKDCWCITERWRVSENSLKKLDLESTVSS